MSYIGIDVGGTFTDLCIFDTDRKEVLVAKTPTTPTDLSVGVRTGLSLLPIEDKGTVRLIHHGTTLVTNAFIERRGARTGLITTLGFRDILEIMRTDRERLYDLQWRRPVPLIPRHLRLEIVERVGPTGDVLIPLDEDSVVVAAGQLVAAGCESIAISLLHSYLNDDHEHRAREIIQREFSDIDVYLSCEVDPQYREYERTSTTAFTAFVGPLVARYLTNLRSGLTEDGFDAKRLSIMQSNGGTMKADIAHKRAAYLFASGPAAGVVGAVNCATLSGFRRVITMDMGGTSCDVSIAQDGRFNLKAEHEVEYQVPVRAPAVDVVSIGAGGGSITKVDEGGALRVGPESAGAMPGPACYGRGGARPTITDANVALGRLSAATIGAGSVTISKEAAEEAIRSHVAAPLGLSVIDAALGIIRIANAMMANAIREVSVARGDDPRDFVLLPFGGAGPLHAADVANELDIPVILVPFSPGVLSALGCMMSDVRFDFMKSVLRPLSGASVHEMQQHVRSMQDEGDRALEKEGFGPDRRRSVVTADMRYVGQVHEVNVDLPDGSASPEEIAELFHGTHRRLYGTPFPGHEIEVVNLRVGVIGLVEKPAWEPIDVDKRPAAPAQDYREVYFATGPEQAAIYQRTALSPGDVLDGPAVIESMDSTVLISPDRGVLVDGYGSLVMRGKRAQ